MARIGSGSGENYFAPGSVPFPGLPFTISCWFNSRIANNFPTIVFISDTNANLYYALWLNVDVGQAVEATAHAGGDRSSNSAKSQTYPLNAWNHTAAIFQSATYRQVYLNGIPGTASTTNQNPTPSSLDHFYIGAFRAGSTTYGVFDGGLADVAIWSTSLTGTEIDLLSSGICPLQVRPDRLFAYWPMTGLNYSGEPDVLGGYPLSLAGDFGVDSGPKILAPYLTRSQYPFRLAPSGVTLSGTFLAAGDSTFSAYSSASSPTTATFAAAGASSAMFGPIVSFQSDGQASAAWNGLAGIILDTSFAADGDSSLAYVPAVKVIASGGSSAAFSPIIGFRAIGSAFLQAVGQSTWESAFTATANSDASFIRFIPKVTPNPSRITPGATVTLTLHGEGTHWTTGAPSLSASGLTFSDLTVVSDTVVTVTAAASTTTQTTTITDATTGGTCNVLIKQSVTWVPPRRR